MSAASEAMNRLPLAAIDVLATLWAHAHAGSLLPHQVRSLTNARRRIAFRRELGPLSVKRALRSLERQSLLKEVTEDADVPEELDSEATTAGDPTTLPTPAEYEILAVFARHRRPLGLSAVRDAVNERRRTQDFPAVEPTTVSSGLTSLRTKGLLQPGVIEDGRFIPSPAAQGGGFTRKTRSPRTVYRPVFLFTAVTVAVLRQIVTLFPFPIDEFIDCTKEAIYEDAE